jgi:hypothetical protein
MTQLIWEQSGDAYVANVLAPDGTSQYRLIAEPNLDGSWYWAIWAPDGTFEARGETATFQSAMFAAERAIPETGA